MASRKLRKKYRRMLLVAAFMVAALVGLLMGATASFILHDHTPSKENPTQQTPTNTGKSATSM